mgnify:CR=1 FL=1
MSKKTNKANKPSVNESTDEPIKIDLDTAGTLTITKKCSTRYSNATLAIEDLEAADLQVLKDTRPDDFVTLGPKGNPVKSTIERATHVYEYPQVPQNIEFHYFGTLRPLIALAIRQAIVEYQNKWFRKDYGVDDNGFPVKVNDIVEWAKTHKNIKVNLNELQEKTEASKTIPDTELDAAVKGGREKVEALLNKYGVKVI